MDNSSEQQNRTRILHTVMIAVAVWGCVMALGTTLFGVDPIQRKVAFSPSLLRGGIAFSMVAAFMGLWFLALGRREARQAPANRAENAPAQSAGEGAESMDE